METRGRLQSVFGMGGSIFRLWNRQNGTECKTLSSSGLNPNILAQSRVGCLPVAPEASETHYDYLVDRRFWE